MTEDFANSKFSQETPKIVIQDHKNVQMITFKTLHYPGKTHGTDTRIRIVSKFVHMLVIFDYFVSLCTHIFVEYGTLLTSTETDKTF